MENFITTAEFIANAKILPHKIHHVNFLYPEPDYGFIIKYKKGEPIHPRLYKLGINKSVYKEDIIVDKYTDAVWDKENDSRHIYKEGDKYPVWFAQGLEVIERNKYGNPSKCWSKYNANFISIDNFKIICDDLNSLQNN